MPNRQRIVDVAIGLSVIGWGTAGTWSNIGERPASILVTVSLLHGVVGVLFLIRSSVKVQGDLKCCLTAMPAVLVGGWVFRFAPTDWNTGSQAAFVIGGGLAIASLTILGRCFAVLPAYRGTVSAGPYAVVRHPAYLGELLMVIACVSATLFATGPSWGQPIVLSLTVVFFVVRIDAEERLLRINIAYQEYCDRVLWRLIPLVW